MDVSAIEDRGRAMGLNPRRHGITAGQKITRKWRVIPAVLLGVGDTIVNRGTIHWIDWLHGDDRLMLLLVHAGMPQRGYQYLPGEVVKAFTEVDVRYGQINGKGVIHITSQDMTREGPGTTLCGKEGEIKIVADSAVEKICSPCSNAATKQG